MMRTRCPACATAFRVTAEQLEAKQGKVRCGQCQHVFNACDHLLERPVGDAASVQASISAPEENTQRVEPVEHAEPEPASAPVHKPAETLDAAEASAEPGATAPTPEASPMSAVPDPLAGRWLTEDAADTDASPKRAWPWALAGMLVLLPLVLQVLLHFRVDLALSLPESRPLLEALCDAFDCEIALPRKPGFLSIETSDLHPDSRGKGRLALTATLKNQAPYAQAYPDLELTLTDSTDRALVRKILPPADYLPKGTAAAPGFAANGEIAVNLSLSLDADIGSAMGYRLYLFYP